LEKALGMKTVASVNEVSDIKDRHGTILVKLKASGNEYELKKIADGIIAHAFSASRKYDIKTLYRAISEDGHDVELDLQSDIVPAIINKWAEYRIQLERDACDCRIVDIDKRVSYLKLMILAVDNVSFILKALRNKSLNDDGLDKYIAKGLKITIEEARVILDLKIRRLKALEKVSLKNEIDGLTKEKNSLLARKKHPNNYIISQLEGFVKVFS
jgi:DNA gyrase/topoisomerase IV subunit A